MNNETERITGVIDRFEGGYVLVEPDKGGAMRQILRENAPLTACEGMVVVLEGDKIVAVDEEETTRRFELARHRFERILGSKD